MHAPRAYAIYSNIDKIAETDILQALVDNLIKIVLLPYLRGGAAVVIVADVVGAAGGLVEGTTTSSRSTCSGATAGEGVSG